MRNPVIGPIEKFRVLNGKEMNIMLQAQSHDNTIYDRHRLKYNKITLHYITLQHKVWHVNGKLMEKPHRRKKKTE